jgi:hypothetical protein
MKFQPELSGKTLATFGVTLWICLLYATLEASVVAAESSNSMEKSQTSTLEHEHV